MFRTMRFLVPLFALTSLSISPLGASSNAPQAPGQETKAIPAIVTALLSNLIASGAQSLTNHFLPQTSGVSTQSTGLPSLPCHASINSSQKISETIRNELMQAGCQVVGQFVGAAPTALIGAVNGLVANVQQTQSELATPLNYSPANGPNYQGLKVSVLVINNQGSVIEERAINAPFYSGEKFRLRVQSTFPGFLEVTHTAPSGATKPLFPRPEIGQFMLAAGGEVILPLGQQNTYEFAGDTGIEQLSFSFRDPRIAHASQAAQDVFRQDTANGSYYAQALAAGQLPYISQSVQLSHRPQN